MVPSVFDFSQNRPLAGRSLLAHDVPFENANAINADLLDSIHSLVSGNTDPKRIRAKEWDGLEQATGKGVPAGLNSTPKLSTYQVPLSTQQELELLSLGFEGFGLDEDLVYQLALGSSIR